MSLLAHATYASRGFDIQKRNLDRRIKDETIEAKNIQKQTGCSWSEALRIASRLPK
jgi:hypothetical protein